MGFYLILVYLHILAAICWIGFTLFWFLMVPPLRTDVNRKGNGDLIHQLEASKWPPSGIPSPVRLDFLYLGWSFLLASIITGIVLLYLRGFTVQEITTGKIFSDGLGRLGIGKVFLVAVVALIELFSKKR
ncbi:MAG: hypothetical protein JSW39_08445, partial [Desulfobacterales bacterium]